MSLQIRNRDNKITFSGFDHEDEIEIEFDNEYEVQEIYITKENVKQLRDYLDLILDEV